MSDIGDDFSWFYDLSPEEQNEVLRAVGYSEANLVPYSFGGATAPGQSETEFDLAAFGGGIPPELNKQGEVQPWGLDQEAQAVTLQKNRNAVMADAITGAFGGPGAYGPRSFAPSYKFGGKPLQQPGQQQAQYYANLAGGGFQSAIARSMLAGTDPSTAVANVIKLATLTPEQLAAAAPEARAEAEGVIASLSPAPPAGAGAGLGQYIQAELGEDATPAQQLGQKYNLRELTDFANNLGAELAKDPDLGRAFQDPQTGLYYETPPEEQWPEPAQKYMSLGLPFPTDRYSSEEYLQQAAPLYEEELSAQEQRKMETSEAQEKASQEFQNADKDLDAVTKAWQQFQEESAKTMPQAVQGRNFYVPGQPTTYGHEVQPGSGQDLQIYPPTRERYQYVDASSPQVQAIGNTEPGAGWSFLDQEGNKYPGPPGIPSNIADIQPYVWSGKSGDMQIGTRDEGGGGFQNLLPRMGMESGFGNRKPDALTEQRVSGAERKKKDARERAIRARQEKYSAETARTPAQRERLRAAGRAAGMEESGRTPLTDALLRRLMVSQTQGLYGGY